MLGGKKLEDRIREKVSEFKTMGFHSTTKYRLPNYLVAFDENSRQWVLLFSKEPERSIIRNFDDVLGAEVIVPGAGTKGSYITPNAYTSTVRLGVRVFQGTISEPYIDIYCDPKTTNLIDPILATFLAIAAQNKKTSEAT